MLTQADIKLINSLKQSKSRRKTGLFIVEGPKMVSELVKYEHFKILFIAANRNWINSHSEIEELTIKEISEKALQKLSNFSTANEVLAVVEIPEYLDFTPNKNSLYLVLDGIQDPGNLGSIIRTSEWFGITDIFCSFDTVDCFNPKVVQATMGSLFRIKCHYLDIPSFLNKQTFPIYGTLLNGKNIYADKLMPEGFIVIGNESKGISQDVQNVITNPLFIPSYGLSKAESLNASIAAAIVCAEFRRSKN